MGKVRERWVARPPTASEMLVVGRAAARFRSDQETILRLLYCQGGPQSVVSQRWSFRWNLPADGGSGLRRRGAEPARAAVVRAGVARPDLG
ncbi:MAG: hypothetical protein ACLR8Y_06300 [Alistipes indistinctus]